MLVFKVIRWTDVKCALLKSTPEQKIMLAGESCILLGTFWSSDVTNWIDSNILKPHV